MISCKHYNKKDRKVLLSFCRGFKLYLNHYTYFLECDLIKKKNICIRVSGSHSLIPYLKKIDNFFSDKEYLIDYPLRMKHEDSKILYPLEIKYNLISMAMFFQVFYIDSTDLRSRLFYVTFFPLGGKDKKLNGPKIATTFVKFIEKVFLPDLENFLKKELNHDFFRT